MLPPTIISKGSFEYFSEKKFIFFLFKKNEDKKIIINDDYVSVKAFLNCQ